MFFVILINMKKITYYCVENFTIYEKHYTIYRKLLFTRQDITKVKNMIKSLKYRPNREHPQLKYGVTS